MDIYRDHQYAALLGEPRTDDELDALEKRGRLLYARGLALTISGFVASALLITAVLLPLFGQARVALWLFLLFWLIVPAAFGVSMLVAQMVLPRKPQHDPLTGRIWRQRSAGPLALAARLKQLGSDRFVWPLAAACVAMPLSIHLIGGLVLGVSVGDLLDYACWALIGSIIAHIYVAIAAARFGRTLSKGVTDGRPAWADGSKSRSVRQSARFYHA
jgi:hypothetical protein